MPHVKLPATIEELERQLAHFADMVKSLPRSAETRRISCQGHVKTLKAKIKALEAKQAKPSVIQLAFKALEQRRLDDLL